MKTKINCILGRILLMTNMVLTFKRCKGDVLIDSLLTYIIQNSNVKRSSGCICTSIGSCEGQGRCGPRQSSNR